jgi:phage terminase small subunit
MELELSERQSKFVLEFLLSGKGTESAVKAGYSKRTASVASAKLLKNPNVKLAIDFFQKQDREKFEIERHEIIRRLWACVTRDARKLLDKDGCIDPRHLLELDEREAAAIDGFKQKILRRFTEDDGTVVEILETEVRLMPLSAALDLAMRHKGLFEAQKNETKLTLDFDSLLIDHSKVIDVDPIEQRLLDEQK